MPIYHFHVNGDRDDEGFEFANIRAAQCQALKMAGRIICDEDSETFWNDGGWSMKVTTPDGTPLFELVLFGFETPAVESTTAQASAAA